MRRYSLVVLVTILVLGLGLGAVACGSGTGNMSPQEMLTAAMDAAEAASSQSGTYEIELALDADTGQMSADEQAMAQMFVGQPIKLTGTFATQTDPVLADLTVAFGLMGANISAGVRVIDDEAWLNVFGEWYVAPAEVMEQVGGTDDAAMVQAMLEIMDEEGIDPNDWFKDLKAVGTETLAGTEVTHLTGSVDVKKMAADVITLMQNPKLSALLDAGSSAAGAGGDLELPTGDELEETQTMLEELFKSATLDVWIAKSDSSMRKMVLNADIAMPAEAATAGLSGAKAIATFNLDAPNKAIDVKAPANAKPIEELETDMQNNPLISGLLGGLLGGGVGDLLSQ